MVDKGLELYCNERIIPLYAAFDKAHREDHVRTVIEQSMQIAEHFPEVNTDMVYAAAVFHDTGLAEGREVHHLASGRIIRTDKSLPRWFSPEQIEIIAQAAEDHRASSETDPRSIYGRILAEADRVIDPDTVILRTIQYGFAHYPELDREGSWARTREHLVQKYGREGYLHLYIKESPNAERLDLLRDMIDDPVRLRETFDRLYEVARCL